MARRNFLTYIALTLLAFTRITQVAAQNTPSIGNPAGMAPNTPGVYDARPDTKQSNTADQLFAHEATLGGQAEIQAGKLAAGKAQSQAVKDFARRMVSEHSSAGERLAAVAKNSGYPPSTQLDMDHRVELDQLQKASGKAFDELYIRAQIIDHQKSAQLYEWIISNGEDARLQSYALEILPTVLKHLEMAKAILADLVGSAP